MQNVMERLELKKIFPKDAMNMIYQDARQVNKRNKFIGPQIGSFFAPSRIIFAPRNDTPNKLKLFLK